MDYKMIRESSGYFSEEVSVLSQDLKETHIEESDKETVITEKLLDSYFVSSEDISKDLKHGRKDLLYKVLEGEKALQKDLKEKLELINEERKETYKEKFSIFTAKTAQRSSEAEKKYYQVVSRGYGSLFNGLDIAEMQNKFREIEGDLKRSELRYDIVRKLTQEYRKKENECKSVKINNIQPINSLLSKLVKNDLKSNADDLKSRISTHNNLLGEYKNAKIREKKLENDHREKLKLPKLKKTRNKPDRCQDISRPFTFSYFPSLTPNSDIERKVPLRSISRRRPRK